MLENRGEYFTISVFSNDSDKALFWIDFKDDKIEFVAKYSTGDSIWRLSYKNQESIERKLEKAREIINKNKSTE